MRRMVGRRSGSGSWMAHGHGGHRHAGMVRGAVVRRVAVMRVHHGGMGLLERMVAVRSSVRGSTVRSRSGSRGRSRGSSVRGGGRGRGVVVVHTCERGQR